MKVTSNIENSNYIRWATGLIEPVINQAGIKCDEATVGDPYIWIALDSAEHLIRICNIESVQYDSQGNPCIEKVSYTLYKNVSDGDGKYHPEEVCSGDVIIEAKRPQL